MGGPGQRLEAQGSGGEGQPGLWFLTDLLQLEHLDLGNWMACSPAELAHLSGSNRARRFALQFWGLYACLVLLPTSL